MPTMLASVPKTVGDVVALYLKHTAAEQTDKTYSDRKRILAEFAGQFPRLRLNRLRGYHLRLWVDAHQSWRSHWTKKRVILTVQRAFNWAVKLGIIAANPVRGVTQCEGTHGRAMTAHEFQSCLRKSSLHFRQVLIFLRYTGCRPCEMAMIEPHHVDLDRGLIVLPIHKTSKKTNRPRVIVLHPVAEKLIRVLIRPSGRVFLNSQGRPWKRYALACRFKRLRKRIGFPLDCRLYGLRHRFGTDGIRNKLGIKTVSVLMGHASTRMTERYIHIEDDIEFLRREVRQAIR